MGAVFAVFSGFTHWYPVFTRLSFNKTLREEKVGEKWPEGLGRCCEEGAQGVGPHRLRGHRWQVRRRQGLVRQSQVPALMGQLPPLPSLVPAAGAWCVFCADLCEQSGARGLPPWFSRCVPSAAALL